MNSTQTNVEPALSVRLNRLRDELTETQINLTKARTFLADMLDDFFEKYECPTKQNLDTLTFMYYGVVHYANYARAVGDYIDNAADTLEGIYKSAGDIQEWVKSMGDTLSGGVGDE